MTRTLRYMHMANIQNTNTVSIINSIHQKYATDAASSGNTNNDNETDGDLAEALQEHSRTGGEHLRRQLDAVYEDKNRKDKGSLTEEQLENVSVWMKTSDANNETGQELENTKQEKLNANFDQYKHHHFFDKWGTIGRSKNKKDEEWWIEEPQSWPENDPRHLCEMCRHINFRVLLSEPGVPGNDLPGPTSIRLHCVDKIVQRQNCSFCRLLTMRIKADGVVSLEDHEKLKQVDICLNVLEGGPETALRLEVELSDLFRRWTTQRYIIQKFDYENRRPFCAIPVCKDKAGRELLRRWLQLCEKEHPQDISRILKTRSSKLRLIDVNENRVVEVDLPCRYICLSYVWGGLNQPQFIARLRSKLEEINGLLDIGLPKTIADAMEVTRSLAIRYLWVDAMCIEQDNAEDKHNSIMSMGSIYSNAVLTIVASTNSNPLKGLPGVTSEPRAQEQIRETVQDIPLAVAFHDIRFPLATVEASVWNSRGWTYQERQLSPRAVFFGDAQMVFTCPHATYFEDTCSSNDLILQTRPVDEFTGAFANPQDLWYHIWTDPTQQEHINMSFQTNDGIVTMIGEARDSGDLSGIEAPIYEHKVMPKNDINGVLEIEGVNIWNIYRKAVASYSQRQLTDPSDAVPAFAGMANLIRRDANIQFWYNLPSCAFEEALLWYPKAPLTRRRQDNKPIFPSWSWAAWQGPVSYGGRGFYNGISRSPVTAIQWIQRLTGAEWLEKHGNDQLAQMSDPVQVEQIKSQALSGDLVCYAGIDPYEWFHFEDEYESSGWKPSFDSARNQHGYTHPTYPGICFPHMIPLPDKPLITIPSTIDSDRGMLSFQAFSCQVRFVETPSKHPTTAPYAEPYLQLGLSDLSMSATARSSTQHIIYHQGYRAGFLTLHAPLSAADLENPEQFSLIALSRDEPPRIFPPSEPFEFYRKLGPAELQWHIGFKSYYKMTSDEFAAQITPPVEDVQPDVSPRSENGDPNYDRGRFRDDGIYPLYNVLLVKKEEEAGGAVYVTRLGVGKMHWCAYHHAAPEWEFVRMR